MMTPSPRVALLVETSRGYGRSVVKGVVNYARLHGPWEFYIAPGDFKQSLPDMLRWKGTGIIARIEDSRIARAIIESGLPAVGLDISQNVPIEVLDEVPFSEIVSDSLGAARMAAEHLMEQDLKHYAFVGLPGRIWSKNREEGFVAALHERGFTPRIYRAPTNKNDRSWARELHLLANWLLDLPKPVGIMACDDDRGRQVLEACSAANISVPMEALVIGVDNDDLLCELAPPPLTSVALNAEAGGFRAAALLDRMMKGERPEPQRILVEPLRVVERRSTERPVASDDRDVAVALDFIHSHAPESITIEDVVSQVNISRRMFEIRFRQVVGRSPHKELMRVRLIRARNLLLETDLPISRIAKSSGFCSPAHLTQAFKAEHGTTPAHFRRQHCSR